MRAVFLASLRTYSRRYVAAAVAVTVAVAFVVVVGILTSGARSGLMDGLGAPYRNAEHVVSPEGWPSSELDPEAVIAFTERHGENASAIGRATLPAHAGGLAALGHDDGRADRHLAGVALAGAQLGPFPCAYGRGRGGRVYRLGRGPRGRRPDQYRGGSRRGRRPGGRSRGVALSPGPGLDVRHLAPVDAVARPPPSGLGGGAWRSGPAPWRREGAVAGGVHR
ncbi:hypothetical protein ACFSTC_19515 [Nonomuraea ferruginea]